MPGGGWRGGSHVCDSIAVAKVTAERAVQTGDFTTLEKECCFVFTCVQRIQDFALKNVMIFYIHFVIYKVNVVFYY